MNHTFKLVCIAAILALFLTSPALAELHNEQRIARDGLEAVGRGLYALGVGIGLAGLFIGLGLRSKNKKDNI